MVTSFAPNSGTRSVSFNSGADADCGVLINEGDCIRRLRAGGGRSKTPLQIGGVDGRSFAGTWVANTSSVQLMTTDYGIASDKRSFSIIIEYGSYLALPVAGITQNDASISLGYNSSRAGSTPSSYLPFRGVGTVPSSSSPRSDCALPCFTFLSGRLAGSITDDPRHLRLRRRAQQETY